MLLRLVPAWVKLIGRTKHQLGVELLTWFKQLICVLGVKAKVWLAVDGAYAVRPFLLPVLALDIVVVSRLRKDACLFDLPPADSHGNRIYGKNKISLAKRGHIWRVGNCTLGDLLIDREIALVKDTALGDVG